jgi:hypothetical protein
VQGLAPLVLEWGDRTVPSPKPPVDAASVVERSRHAITAVPGTAGAFRVTGDGYRAGFEAGGFTYAPADAPTALTVSLDGIARGGREIALSTGPWTARENVAQRAAAAGIRERVTARAGEVEWDVVLADRPAGTGDLAVRGRLAGVVDAAEPAVASGGRQFELALDGGSTVRLGEVVVKDATGAVLHRGLPTVEGGTVELLIPDAVLTGARYPLLVDPTVSNPIPVTARAARTTPSLAFNGTNFLFVWADKVNGGLDIYGSLVSANGGTVNPAVEISSSRDKSDYQPDVAWNGERFLVVWRHDFTVSDPDIHAQLVDASGARFGSLIVVSNPTSFQTAPAVAAGGTDFLVTWQDHRNEASPGTNADTEIYTGRVDRNGSVLDGSGLRLPGSNDGGVDVTPDVAWNGSRYLVVWEADFLTNNDVRGQFVTPGGAGSTTNAIAFPEASRVTFDPAVASNGNGFLVVWQQGTSDPATADVRGARVPNTTFPPDMFQGTGFPIVNVSGGQGAPAVAFRGTYLVAWQDQREPPHFDIYAARVDGSSVLDPNGFAVIRAVYPSRFPAVAPAQRTDSWAVAYQAGADVQSGIEFQIAAK